MTSRKHPAFVPNDRRRYEDLSRTGIDRAPECIHSLQDIADVLRRMSSNEWAERKDGLASLYHMVRSGRSFK